MSRVIFHLDMDAFYASVEQRDSPSLKGRPVVVGASPNRRGVVCAASYEARAFGVRSAMSSRAAQQLCPHAVFIPPRINAYVEESHAIMSLLDGFGALVEQVSVDEAYLDMSHRFPDPDPDASLQAAVAVGKEMKQIIWEQRCLKASIGLATNKLLAKMASDHGKPDGLFCISESQKVTFLRPLPASAIHGVGKVTAKILADAGMLTIGHLQDYPGDLRAYVGSFGTTLRGFAFGEDPRPVQQGSETKSISTEDTFQRDTDDRRILVPLLKQQAREVASRLTKERLAARTIQIKVRYSDFRTVTRQTSLEEPTESEAAIYTVACSILRRHRLIHRPIRLLGLGLSALSPPSAQLTLPL